MRKLFMLAGVLVFTILGVAHAETAPEDLVRSTADVILTRCVRQGSCAPVRDG
jgi:hypothetical protein